MHRGKEASKIEFEITCYHHGSPIPTEVELKFQLPYPCWLKLEDSQLFQIFLEGLEALQKEELL